MLLAPRLQLLAHCTRARDQRDKPNALLQAQAQRAFTVCLTVGHNTAQAVESQRYTLLNRHGSLGAITGIAIAQAHAEWEASTAHAKTQEHLLEIRAVIFAVPVGRTRHYWPLGLLRRGLGYGYWALIGPIQGQSRRVLMNPGRRDGIDFQSLQGQGAKDPIEVRRK
jgi:hypothetical protein